MLGSIRKKNIKNMKTDELEYHRPIDHFEYNSKISSKYISHFTPKFEMLLKIIENGFRPNECDEFQIYKQDYFELEVLNNWYTKLAGGIASIDTLTHPVPMVSFCDIPNKLSTKHRIKYGKYCIVLTKRWAISKGLSPLIYVPKNSKIHTIINSINIIKDRLVQQNQEEGNGCPEIIQLNEKLESLFEFIKPYINKNNDYKFYDEREWRYTPPSLVPFDPDNEANYLSFGKDDFLFAIVQNSQEKNIILTKLRSKFGYISSKRIKIKRLSK